MRPLESAEFFDQSLRLLSEFDFLEELNVPHAVLLDISYGLGSLGELLLVVLFELLFKVGIVRVEMVLLVEFPVKLSERHHFVFEIILQLHFVLFDLLLNIVILVVQPELLLVSDGFRILVEELEADILPAVDVLLGGSG